MKRCVVFIVGIAVMSGLAGPASAQDSLPPSAPDSAAASQLSQIVNAVRANGLPADPIIAMARLGALTHAPSARIVAAARLVAARLATARTALAPKPSAADIAAGEDALSIGVQADALRVVRAASPNRSVAVPLGVLAQLVASGVPTKRAMTMVTDLMKQGVTNTQLVALGNDVNADVARGARPEASLETRMGGLTAVLAPGASSVGAAFTGSSVPTGPKKPQP
ncbi:MAG: hypothetical protein ACREMU_13400 [Gemmatimonadaceae bacterium]